MSVTARLRSESNARRTLLVELVRVPEALLERAERRVRVVDELVKVVRRVVRRQRRPVPARHRHLRRQTHDGHARATRDVPVRTPVGCFCRDPRRVEHDGREHGDEASLLQCQKRHFRGCWNRCRSDSVSTRARRGGRGRWAASAAASEEDLANCVRRESLTTCLLYIYALPAAAMNWIIQRKAG